MKRLVRAGSPEIVKIVGDSSPSSAEISFRELDDVFLQTQTRIWLGEVLHIRFDEETTITDLLADGELLFQVSKRVWKMLLKKHVELKHSKVYIYERTSSGKNDGRYMPYPKVDSFLKICQILGLTGIDLFSPSDVVEKRDARRVCMCIRSFSKKARSKKLNVPDFDIVTYTIAMPTDLVGGIRRNLEQSQYSSSSSNGCTSPSTDPRELYREKGHGRQNCLHYDSHSESDEAENGFIELESQSPLSNGSYDGTNFSNIIGQHSPEENLVVDGDLFESQTQFRLDTHEHGSHELKDALYSKSSLFHTECRKGIEKVTSPLRSPRNIIEINNFDTNAYRKFASNYEYLLHDLDEQRAVEAEEDFVQFGPALQCKGHEINLPIYTFTDSVVTHNEEFVKTLAYSPSVDETVSCRLVDEGVRSEFMESSTKNNILEIHYIVNEKIPPAENEVDDGGKKDGSGNNSFQMDHRSAVDDPSDLIVNDIDDGNYGEIPAKGPNPSMEFLDLGQKDVQNGFRKKAVDEVEATHLYSISRSISSNDECTDDDFTLKERELSHSKFNISPNDGNQGHRVETGGSDTDPTVYAGRENQDAGSNRTSSSCKLLLDKDCHSVSCSDSDSLENDQVSSFSFNHNPTMSDFSTNESKISCSKDGCALREVHGDVEIDSDEHINYPVMSIMDDEMIGNDLPIGETKMSKSTTFDVSVDRLMDSNTDGAMKVKNSQEKDVCHPTYGMYENPPAEIQKDNTEKPSIDDNLCLEDLSVPVTADVYFIKGNDKSNGNGKGKQEAEKCNEELMPKLNSTEKAEVRTRVNKVLKSVVGTLTLLGAIFVVHHVRQKRTKDENSGFISPQQNHKPNQEFPTQKRVEIVKPAAVPTGKSYPGERLKF